MQQEGLKPCVYMIIGTPDVLGMDRQVLVRPEQLADLEIGIKSLFSMAFQIELAILMQVTYLQMRITQLLQLGQACI
jgi:hypothetical protein